MPVAAPRPLILVVAAALFDGAGRILIAQRPAGKTLAGRWEFPGGKVSAGESERSALGRELHEELGIEVVAARPFMRLTHAYDERDVELSLWIVECFSGAPRSLDSQALKWVAPEHLGGEDILEADSRSSPRCASLGSGLRADERLRRVQWMATLEAEPSWQRRTIFPKSRSTPRGSTARTCSPTGAPAVSVA